MLLRFILGGVFLGLARFAQVMYSLSDGNPVPALIGVLWATTAVVLLGGVLWELIRD